MKVKKEFLIKVIKCGSIDTPKYRYKVRNITTPEYQYAIIERVEINSLPCNNSAWKIVATTWDGKNFLHA